MTVLIPVHRKGTCTGSTRNIQGAHGAHGADMENIRSIQLTRNTRNAARSIHKDGVRRGFETNADCYSMTRGNLEIKNLGPGGEGWGPAFPFVSLYGAPVIRSLFAGSVQQGRTAPHRSHHRCLLVANTLEFCHILASSCRHDDATRWRWDWSASS